MHKRRKKSDVKVIQVRPEKLVEVTGGGGGAVECGVDCGVVAVDCSTAAKRSL